MISKLMMTVFVIVTILEYRLLPVMIIGLMIFNEIEEAYYDRKERTAK